MIYPCMKYAFDRFAYGYISGATGTIPGEHGQNPSCFSKGDPEEQYTIIRNEGRTRRTPSARVKNRSCLHYTVATDVVGFRIVIESQGVSAPHVANRNRYCASSPIAIYAIHN